MSDIQLTNIELRRSKGFNLKIEHLALQKGKCYGVIGRNGAGKSTLFKLLSHAITPDTGKIEIATNKPLMALSPTACFPPRLKLKTIAGLIAKADWQHQRWVECISILKIAEHQRYGGLSTGEQAAVRLAAYIAQPRDIWLLDEVLLGVDVVASQQMLTMLSMFFTDDMPCMLYSSHNTSELERLADEILLVDNGELTNIGSPVAKTPGLSFGQEIFQRLQGDAA